MSGAEIELLDHRDIRVATRIFTLFQQSYALEAELIGVVDFPPLRRSVHDIPQAATTFRGCANETGLAGVIEADCTSAGFCIESLVVAPHAFRRGVATRLLISVMDNPRWETIAVQTAKANTPALSLYRKFGFEWKKSWLSQEGIELVSLEKSRKHRHMG